MQTTQNYLDQLRVGKTFRQGLYRTLPILSLLVICVVFWGLKLTGITMAGEAFCGKDEHVHDEICAVRELICELEEEPPHVHGQECKARVLQCDILEQQEYVLEEIVTQEEISPEEEIVFSEEFISEEDSVLSEEVSSEAEHAEKIAHVHEDSCYVFIEDSFICGYEEHNGHVHGEECYRITATCLKEEHIHDASCYSDITADIENYEVWEEIVANVAVTNSPAEKTVAIARSQLGCQESILNFQVDTSGIRRGITRYGQWYGNPYGDWSTMFVGFCLQYSVEKEFPMNAGSESMRMEWDEFGYYTVASEYAPATGDVAFLDKDGNGQADAVAIVATITDGQIEMIEGDVQDSVVQSFYAVDDTVILGYGKIPVEQPFMPREGTKVIAQTEEYSQALFDNGNCLVIYVSDDEGHYALDGYGGYEEIVIDPDGRIYTDAATPELLLWNVASADDDSGYIIQNMVSQMLLPQNDTNVKTYSLRETADESEAGITYQYARAVYYSLWLDGTCGGLMSYSGSPNQGYTVVGGGTFTLPTYWQSPTEHNYVLNGWYDVINHVHYAPGASVPIYGNRVFYADWIESSYDMGTFNSQVADTVSTNEFVTTRMFDYNILFNVLSARADVQVSGSGHSETWRLITSGNSPYSGERTLNYIFRDWDQGGQDITFPSGVEDGSPHYPTAAGSVYSGLYNDRIGTLLFDPNVKTIGKKFLGTADHLFQLEQDPTDAHFGYYYYDSERNAVSYNQSEERFYVYEYLEQTTVSATTDGIGKYSDFLPFNSPYVHANGRNPATYHYAGKHGEYNGVTHYMYDATDSADSNVSSNFLYGMSIEIDFYLPNTPGSGANPDVYGRDMHFKFSGDDDVWVFVDDKMVLDLGGIHGVESGDINFSSGIVTINGVVNNSLSNTLRSVGAGEHTLTFYYLERGSSMSNCAIYFNLSPRFSFSIQKEDTLSKEILNGAQFSVYMDRACTQPARLWSSKESHDNGDAPTNVFTVTNGVADMWGMGAATTYYIKETKPPDAEEYTYAHGIICVTIDKQGLASYNVELLEDGDKGISNGFQVHGFRIDEKTQSAYIVATNAPKWVNETTEVWIYKKWEDEKDHSNDIVTVYLTITDPDGIVRRLQEVQLSGENGWRYKWKNLPKYRADGTAIQYGVEEAYFKGYYSDINLTDAFKIVTTNWIETTSLEAGKTYVLKTGYGCLSVNSLDEDTGFKWVSEEEARYSSMALWTVSRSGNGIKLTNGVGHHLTFYYNDGANGYPTDFFAYNGTEGSASRQSMKYVAADHGIRIYYDGEDYRDYYLAADMTDAKKFHYNTDSRYGLIFTPITKVETVQTEQIPGVGYEITNEPLEQETSVTVYKRWDYGSMTPDGSHEKMQVSVKLLADGKEVGRTLTLNYKNEWKDTFLGLPYRDANGNVIRYSVEENWNNEDWIPYYGEIVTHNGQIPTYSTTITNKHRWGVGGPELPSTGSPARLLYLFCGLGIMLSSLGYGIASRRKRERRIE